MFSDQELNLEKKKVERLMKVNDLLEQRVAEAETAATQTSRFTLNRSTSNVDEGKVSALKTALRESDSIRKALTNNLEQNDIEMLALCNQLSHEMGEKSALTIELHLLHESRDLEMNQLQSEIKALNEKLSDYKVALAKAQKTTNELEKERNKWKSAYDQLQELFMKDESLFTNNKL